MLRAEGSLARPRADPGQDSYIYISFQNTWETNMKIGSLEGWPA